VLSLAQDTSAQDVLCCSSVCSRAGRRTEERQKKERQATENMNTGRVSGPFVGVEELRKHLARPTT